MDQALVRFANRLHAQIATTTSCSVGTRRSYIARPSSTRRTQQAQRVERGHGRTRSTIRPIAL